MKGDHFAVTAGITMILVPFDTVSVSSKAPALHAAISDGEAEYLFEISHNVSFGDG